ncbi:MAG: hypothetical protein FJ095_01295 [Deltaproteobacteria bacterium]|nr:hypothetical protein [Deltaproteobacteria bacterium]
MARYPGPPLSFDYPRDWLDRTEVRFEAPPRPGVDGVRSPGGLSCTRATLAADESLERHVERALAAFAQREGFLAREVSPLEVDGRRSLLCRYASVEGGVPLEHRAVYVPLAERGVAVLTMSAPRLELAQMEPLFERMLSSVTVGRSG